MKKTDETVVINGVSREVWVDEEGHKFVEQEGDMILVRGAKMFKSDVSRAWPVDENLRTMSEEVRTGEKSFLELPVKEQEERLKGFFTGVLDHIQTKDGE
jgi:uncharacterized protein YbcV (DUF1398 family)